MSDTFNFSLRMPEDVGETIYSLSKESKIPMNSLIVMMLESAIKEKTRKRKTPITRFPRTRRKNKEQEPAMNE
jgi:hypothetical protein